MRYPIVGLIAVLFVVLSWAFVRNSPDEQAAAQGPAAKSPAVVGPDHPVVPGFERFYADDKSDAARGGQLLLGELNCISCHKAEGCGANAPNGPEAHPEKMAPILSDVGGRIKPAFLRKFLASPLAVKPGTTMPDLFAGLTEAQRA